MVFSYALVRPLCLLSTLVLAFIPHAAVALAFSAETNSMAATSSSSMIVATRLHLGQSSSPPTDLDDKVAGFYDFCRTSCPKGTTGVLAVDATPKIAGYNLVDAVQAACEKCHAADSAADDDETPILTVLPVTPWGKFVPALNALVQFSASQTSASQILFCSAETSASPTAVSSLQAALTDDTLVAGALLQGHEYKVGAQALTGRSSPWNTLALWDLKKLALTGFLLVSDGLLTDDAVDPSFGIEEVAATCLLQQLLGADKCKSKLVKCTGIDWKVTFDDPERAAWQDKKMKSKLTRAQRQLELTGLKGVVHHC